MATLKFPQTAPPGGFRYRQMDTGLTLMGDSLEDLVHRVSSHRRYKGLPRDDAPSVSLDVQRQICTRLGAEDCKAEEGDPWVPVPVTPRFTLTDILAFSRTALEFIKSGGQMVPIAEAQRRREICAACPLNQPATGCKCAVFYKMVEAFVPRERHWDDMQVCQICHCSNAVKVNVPLSVIEADKRKLEFPVHCWMRKDLPPAQ